MVQATSDLGDGPGPLYVVEHHPRTHLGPDRPLVVLVHGSLDRATSFARVVRRLEDLPVITYDRRGYERSRQVLPIARTVEEHAQDLLSVIGERSAVVVGHSYGGDVALQGAIEAPEKVLAVGAYEPPMPWTDWWPRFNRTRLEAEDAAAYAEGFFKRISGEETWDRLSERARAARRADGPALAAELTTIRQRREPLDFSRLSVPAAFARGETSLPHHRRAAAELAQLIPGSKLVEIPGAAHGAHLSHPGAFADLVRTVRAMALDRSDPGPTFRGPAEGRGPSRR